MTLISLPALSPAFLAKKLSLHNKQQELTLQDLNNGRKQVGYAFWFWWMLVSTIGLFIVVMIGQSGIGEVFLTVIVFGLSSGIVIGVLQWLVLRQQLNQAYWWVLATAVGWSTSLIIVSRIQLIDKLSDEWFVFYGIIFGIVSGVIVGAMQWLILKQQVIKAGWWVLISIISYTGGSTLGAGAAYILSVDMNPMVGAVVFWLTFAAVFGIISGAITGTALIWLLRQPISAR